MRILFVGNADNPLLVDLALELKRLHPGCVIHIISEGPSRHAKAEDAFDLMAYPRSGSRWRSVRGLKFLWFLRAYGRLLNATPDGFDAVHIFYLSGIWGVLAAGLRSRGRRLLITLFGSDVYRTGALMRPLQRRLIRRAAIVTATNEDTLAAARRVFGVPLTDARIVRFGLRTLDHVSGLRSRAREEHKKFLGIPEDRTVIVVGTNGARRQRHKEIINALSGLPASRKKELFIVVPMTMGGELAHTGDVVAACRDSGIPHRVQTELLSEEDLARLRCAADILIQVQPTDQLSGAMQEHLFAGSVVITGSWLPYDVFRKAGVTFWTVDDPGELRTALIDGLEELGTRRARCLGNHVPIGRLSAWSENAPRWLALYTA